MPAKILSKFLQDRDTFTYVMFELQLAVTASDADTFDIHSDISQMDRTPDLRARGDRAVLVKKMRSSVSRVIESNYLKVEAMDPLIDTYRAEYSSDLAERVELKLKSRHLPATMGISTLLDLTFGPKSRIVGCVLITSDQYDKV